MATKIYFYFFLYFYFGHTVLYWPLKRQKNLHTCRIFYFMKTKCQVGFCSGSNRDVVFRLFFIIHPSLIFANGLPYAMTTLSVVTIQVIGVFYEKAVDAIKEIWFHYT